MFQWCRRLKSFYVVPVCVAVLAMLNALDVFNPPNRWLYDHASHFAYTLRWQAQAEAAGVYQQKPVLIAVDEASLQSIGRWPWSRSIHAQLLNRLNGSTQTPSVLAMDILFAEPQIEGVVSIETDEDAQLARAIQAAGFPVVLATQLDVSRAQMRLMQPRQPLSSSPAKIAHAQIDADQDGSVRRYWPIDDSFLGLALPYLGKAMLAPERAPKIGTSTAQINASALILENRRSEWLYPLPKHWIQVLSYQAVLSGQAPAESWAGVPVLVAATATGLGDQYVSHLYSPSSVLAGGDLVMGAYHTERLLQAGFPHLTKIKPEWQWLSVLLCVGGVYFGLRRSGNVGRQVWVVSGALALVLGAGLIILAHIGVWMNAAQLILAVFLTWVLWASHALQRLLGFLLLRLQQGPVISMTQPSHYVPAMTGPSNKSHKSHKSSAAAQDFIDEQLLTAQAIEERQAVEFKRLKQVLEMLPDAAFVLSVNTLHDQVYAVSFQNLAARQLVQRFPSMHLALQKSVLSLESLLQHLAPDLTEQQQTQIAGQAQGVFAWQNLPALVETAAFTQGVEASGPQDERFLVKLAYLQDLQQYADTAIVVLSIVDLSVSKALAEAFERTLSFLSHDLRAPQATILALLELEAAEPLANTVLHHKIQYQAQRTLQLAEGFVQWSQASHSAAYQMVEYNLNDLMVEALDEQWASAKQKGIALSGIPPEHGIWVKLDRNLMWRALVNLISNALNACHAHGLAGARIELNVRVDSGFGVIEVSDNGPGIPAAAQGGLFQPFVQGQGLKRTGAGLGLAFVKTVLDQHHGQVRVHSPILTTANWPESGTRFELWLPLLPDSLSDDAPSTLVAMR